MNLNRQIELSRRLLEKELHAVGAENTIPKAFGVNAMNKGLPRYYAVQRVQWMQWVQWMHLVQWVQWVQ